jgi:hypothetical protein
LIPYSKIQLEDIVKCQEPYICSMNVELSVEAYERWKHWMSAMQLDKRGLVMPELEEAVGLAGEFTNVYLLKDVIEEQCRAASERKVLLLEVCPELERIWAQLFPEMKVLRLYASRRQRVLRLLQRYRPQTRLEWVVASLKILHSVSTEVSKDQYTNACYWAMNETEEDAEANIRLIEKILRLTRTAGRADRQSLNLPLALAL